MCTVSWSFGSGGYDLLFSRDEQRSRLLGVEPQSAHCNGISFLSPWDPQGGGSWIFSNEYGLTACLLNQYDPGGIRQPAAVASRSRGRLLLSLVSASDPAGCDVMLSTELRSCIYAPCFILVVSPDAGTECWIWGGSSLHRMTAPVRPPITTSSWDGERICSRRREAFRAITAGSPSPTPAQLQKFHEAGGQPASAESVRMSRSDARTVSLTHVVCRDGFVTMHYAAREGDAGFSSPSTRVLSLAHTSPTFP